LMQTKLLRGEEGTAISGLCLDHGNLVAGDVNGTIYLWRGVIAHDDVASSAAKTRGFPRGQNLVEKRATRIADALSRPAPPRRIKIDEEVSLSDSETEAPAVPASRGGGALSRLPKKRAKRAAPPPKQTRLSGDDDSLGDVENEHDFEERLRESAKPVVSGFRVEEESEGSEADHEIDYTLYLTDEQKKKLE